MSSNTLTKEEFDVIIYEMTGDRNSEDKILYKLSKDSFLNVTFAVLVENKQIVEYKCGVNYELFTELLGKFVACKQESDPNRENGCEALKLERGFMTSSAKNMVRTKQTHFYKDIIREIINYIKKNEGSNINLEKLFVSVFDHDNYQNYKQAKCNVMMFSPSTSEIIEQIYKELSQIENKENVLSDKEKKFRRPISNTFKKKLQKTANMDQLLKFFKLFNNSAQVYGTKKCALVGGKRRKTKLKKRRKKRKSQKKRKLKSFPDA